MQGGGCTPNTLFFLVHCLQPLLHISLDLAPPTKVPSRQMQGLGLDAVIQIQICSRISTPSVTPQDAFEKGHDPEDCQKGGAKVFTFF